MLFRSMQDGKQIYNMSEYISNLDIEEITQVREGYLRLIVNRKIQQDELEALDREAFALGYNMQNFTQWYDAQPFVVRSNAKIRVIRESYSRGVEVRIEENQELNRVCIFIQGEPNTGKTYAAKAALSGQAVLSVGGGGTGKFDKLRPDHNAIIIDDDICPNLLNMSDNYICRAYKRNNNNPAWAGKYFIVTSNMTFSDWLERCGIHTIDGRSQISTPHYVAMDSRFFICRLVCENGINRLALTSPSTRGSCSAQIQRADAYVTFVEKFNAVIATYTPTINTVDYSCIIEK